MRYRQRDDSLGEAIPGGEPEGQAEMTDSGPSTVPTESKRPRRGRTLVLQIRQLIRAINDGDDATVEAAVLQLSRSRRYLAPLALAVGAFVMLFQGLKLVFSEWRLTLVQILPAMWIWAAMLDLKVHVLKGREFQIWRGPLAALLILVIALISVAAFYLNAVFAFALTSSGKPDLRSAFAQAWRQIGVVAAFGFPVGVALGFSAIVVPRWGLRWFALSMSIVVGVMMLTYVAVPSRLVGLKSTYSGRDKLTATVVAGAFGAVVCAPGYAIGRTGILLLGSHRTFVFVLGVVMLSVGFAFQAGASGAVKAIKMSAKLAAGNLPPGESDNGSASPAAAGPSLSPGAIDADAAPGG